MEREEILQAWNNLEERIFSSEISTQKKCLFYGVPPMQYQLIEKASTWYNYSLKFTQFLND